MRTNNKQKKLTVTIQTVRLLDPRELTKVAGASYAGVLAYCTGGCFKLTIGC